MDGTQDTNEDDMSFEYTGPAIIVPFNRPPKRDFDTFLNDEQSRPVEQNDRPAFRGDDNQQSSTSRGHYSDQLQPSDAPSWMHWGFCRTLEAVHFTCTILQTVYAATVMAAVAVAVAPAKRRLVSFVQQHPGPAPVRRLLWPRRSLPRLFHQNPSTSPTFGSTTRISPPKFRSTASSPFHIPGRFPTSPASAPNSTPAAPANNNPIFAVDTAISPLSNPVDQIESSISHRDESVSSKTKTADENTTLSSQPIKETSLSPYNSTGLPRYSHASVRELQGIRKMFCREDEKVGYIAKECFPLAIPPSPVPARERRPVSPPTSSMFTSNDELARYRRSSSPVSIVQEEANTPLKSSIVMPTGVSMEPLWASSPGLTPQVEVNSPLKSSTLTPIDRLIESTRTPSAVSSRKRQVTMPLKSSLAKSTSLGRLHPARTPPSKGWIHQLVSSVKVQKRVSPLQEIHDGGNGRQVKASRIARFSENPVSATKRFVKNETISYPSPISSRDESSILSRASSLDRLQISPTQQEQDAMIADQLMCCTPGMTVHATGAVSELISGPGTIANSDHSEMLGSQSSDAHESSQSSPTANEISGHIEAANYDRSGTPTSQSSDDLQTNQDSPTKSEAIGHESVISSDLQNFNPATPPSKLPEAFENLTVSGRRSSRRTKEKEELKEKRRLEHEAIAAEQKARKEKEEAEEKARKAKAEADEKARKQAEEEEERKKHARRMPLEKVIRPLTAKWEDSVTNALAQAPTKPIAKTIKGTDITRRDIGFVLPQRGTKDDQRGYLNDAIIEAYLLAVVDRGNEIAGHKRGETPKFHAFNNFFYDNLKDHGPERVMRWSKRAKIAGKDLLKAEWIFIPICESLHWTLLVVSGTRKTIEYFDSLNGPVMRRVDNVKKWLKSELGSGYKDEEWKVVEDPELPGRGKGPAQNNGSDCGVFVITTAKMVSLGVDPMAVLPTDMITQRRRLIAELINGGFTGDFEPNIVFE